MEKFMVMLVTNLRTWRPGNREFDCRQKNGMFCSPHRGDRKWTLYSLLTKLLHEALSSGVIRTGALQLSAQRHLESRLRMHKIVSALPLTYSWFDAYLNRDTVYSLVGYRAAL
jgi:hypothetical protein